MKRRNDGDEILDVAPIAAPGIEIEGVRYVATIALVTWLRACASNSTEVAASTCRALADAVERWGTTS